MADDDLSQPIIVKKIVKGGHGHHGGAWKVAYADFVTAMMAFFLLLWLLNATTEEQRSGIADYFTPEAVSKAQSGAGGLFGGVALNSDGALRSTGGPTPTGGITVPLPAADEEPTEELTEEDEIADVRDPEELTDEELEDELAEREQKQFEEAAEALREAIAGVPELAELGESLMIEQTPEGLRIQLVDQDKYSMFSLASAEPLENTRKLLQLVAEAVGQLPNRLSVSGHTDAIKYRGGGTGYTNWELSADRANAARRTLIDAGLEPKRIALVQGKADTEPLVEDEPDNPRNRRISIVLLRENQFDPTPELPQLDPDGGVTLETGDAEDVLPPAIAPPAIDPIVPPVTEGDDAALAPAADGEQPQG